MLMTTVVLDKKKKTLTLTMPLEKPRPSASRKTVIIASTHGHARGEASYSGQPVFIVANAFIYPESKTKIEEPDVKVATSAASGRRKESL